MVRAVGIDIDNGTVIIVRCKLVPAAGQLTLYRLAQALHGTTGTCDVHTLHVVDIVLRSTGCADSGDCATKNAMTTERAIRYFFINLHHYVDITLHWYLLLAAKDTVEDTFQFAAENH